MTALVDGRLPRTVIPTRYNLTLTVVPEKGYFTGSVAIRVHVGAALQSITLHALDLEITEAGVKIGRVNHPAEISADPLTETITLILDQPIPIGHATVRVRFSGKLNQEMKGLYEATSGTERYAFTQFEATDARRAFPCFDEPAFKASFRLTATVPDHLTAISNMPVEAVSPNPTTRRKRLRFAETPLMSTYLVALAVARLVPDETEIAGTKVTVYTRPEHAALTGFAKEVMDACLPRLTGYFDLSYPAPKLDLIGVPDFAAGAMENWGAIFFRESRLVVDREKASAATLRDAANTITHEVVHQWFGNLVTMEWWDDLWLNESFATWLAWKIVDEWRPKWQSWVEFARDKQVPLGVDALASTRPISARVRTAAEIEEMFDALTYEKGASVLRMLEQFLGENAFRQGIRDYMRTRRYGNAPAAALWEALAQASGRPVPEIARDWFTKPGFPLVTVSAKDSELTTVHVEQKRFVAAPETREDSGASWVIPLALAFEDEEGVQQHRHLMSEARAEIVLPAHGRVRWVYANAGERGFYRAQYDPALRKALTDSITRLCPEERVGLLDDTWALVNKGVLPIDEFLDLATRFRGDDTRAVVEGLAGFLETLGARLVTEPDHPKFATFIADFYQPLVASLGWDARPDEGDDPKLARATVLWALGSLAKPADLVREMAGRLERYWADPASLDPTLTTAVLRLCARTGGQDRFDRYLERYQAATTPEDRDRYLVAFGDFAEPTLTSSILALTLSDVIRGQDLWRPLRGLLSNPATQADTWAFIKTRWSGLRKKGGSVGAQRIIGGLKTLWKREWLTDVESFFADPANRVESAERSLKQSLEFIQLGLAFRQAQEARLAAWLERQRSAATR